jgi:hypothetical protein
VRPAPTLWRARPARPVLRSSVQVPCNHSCEAIAPVRLISVHRRRNLNGDSLMASKLRAPYRSDGPAGKVAVSGLLQALRLLEVLWIMSAMPSLSCVPRFLSLSALAIRTRSVEV